MKNTYTAQTGITADQSSGITDPAGSISGWMQAMLISALAMAIYHGYADAQETLDYFMPFFSDGILGDGNTNPSVSHEMLTLYRIQLIVDGVPVPNLRGAYEAMMTFNDPHYQPNFPNGWPQPENSVARISGLMGSGYNPSQYQGGDYCNYPTSPTGYAANLNCAVNAIKQYATDQTTALAIWNAFQPHVARIDFSTTAKYNRISFG